MMSTPQTTEDFVKALTLAWKRLGLYPENHPARAGAMNAPLSMLHELLRTAEPLSLAATEGALLSADDRLESLPAIELAKALYAHNVGVVRFFRAVTASSLERFSSQLRSADRKHASFAAALTANFGESGVPGIEVEEVDYSSLVSQLDNAEEPEARLTLLERLLRLQLDEQSFVEAGALTQPDFEQFTTALRRHLSVQKEQSALLGTLAVDFKQQLVSALEQHFTDGVGAGFHILDLDHMRKLFAELPGELRIGVISELLGRLLGVADADAAVAALETTTNSSDLLNSVRQLRREGVPFSRKAQRMAEQLIDQIRSQQTDEFQFSFADFGQRLRPTISTIAPATLDDPTQTILGAIPPSSGPLSASLEEQLDTLTPDRLRQALLSTLLELVAQAKDGEVLPPEQVEGVLLRLADTFHELILTGHTNAAIAVFRFLQKHYGRQLSANHSATTAALQEFSGVRTSNSVVERISLASSPESYSALHDLVRSGPKEVATRLVGQLSDCDDRRTRRRLFSFLLPLKPLILEEVRGLLQRREWFHVRNGISLLDGMEDLPSIGTVRALSLNDHHQVRDAAIRFLARLDTQIPVEIIAQWFDSDDPQFARRTIQLLGRRRQRNAVAPLLDLLSGVDTFRRQREARAAAIVALAQIGDSEVGAKLAEQFDNTLRLQHPEEKRLFYETLGGYSAADRRGILERGVSSRDPAIRQVCEQQLSVDQQALGDTSPGASS